MTPLTSMVVTKPNETEELYEPLEEPDVAYGNIVILIMLMCPMMKVRVILVSIFLYIENNHVTLNAGIYFLIQKLYRIRTRRLVGNDLSLISRSIMIMLKMSMSFL